MNRFHPIFRFTALAAILIVTMFVRSPIVGTVSLFGGLLTLSALQNFNRFIRSAAFYILITLLTAVTNPLFSHRGATPLFFINDKSFTLEAVVYGLTLGISLSGALAWFSVLNLILDKSELLSVIGRVSPKIAVTVTMAMGFIPKLRRTYSQISQAQKASGICVSEKAEDKLQMECAVFAALADRAIENAAEASASMKCRRYGEKRRTYADIRPLTAKDIILSIAALLLSAAVLILSGRCHGEWSFYPVIRCPDKEILTVIPFCISAFAPSMIIIKEKVKWKYLRAKI